MKKLLTAILAATMIFSLAACNSGSTPEKDAPTTEPIKEEGNSQQQGNPTDEKMVIGFSVSTLNNPFFVSLTDGAKSKAESLGAEVIVVDARDDSAKQANDIEDLISKKINVLIVNPVDSDAVSPAVGDAKEKGIKVVSVDRSVNGEEVDCAIASDNVLGAEMATEYLLELIGEKANVAELKGVEGSSAAIDRGTGFHNVADEKLTVVASQTANFNRAEGLTVMENILQANPDLKGVFAHNDEMALGAIEAVNGKDIAIIGFDATDDAKTAIQAGTMKATVAQKPDLMGETAVDVAVKLIKGESVDKVIGVDVELIK